MAKNSMIIRNSLELTPTSVPTSPVNGDIYYDSGSNTFQFYQNGQWITYFPSTNTLGISDGGTGDTSFTAYAPVIGGTTSTGSLQSASSGMSNSGYVLTSTGSSSAPTWQASGGGGSGYSVSSISSNTNAVSGTLYLVTTSSSAITVTLPSPVANDYVYVKDVSGNAQTHNITIAQHASETIDGATSYVLTFNYGFAEVVSDGTNWFVIDRNPNINGWNTSLSFTPSAGFGTTTSAVVSSRREADSLHVRGSFVTGTLAASTVSLGLPVTTNTSSLGSNAVQVGNWWANTNSATDYGSGNIFGAVFYDGSTSGTLYFAWEAASETFKKSNGSDSNFSSSNLFSYEFTIPVSGWNAT